MGSRTTGQKKTGTEAVLLYLLEEGVAQEGAGTWPGEEGEEIHITHAQLHLLLLTSYPQVPLLLPSAHQK